MTRISTISVMALLFLLSPLYGVMAEETKEEGTAEADTAVKGTEVDTVDVQVWMNAIWKRISELTTEKGVSEGVPAATPQTKPDEPISTLGVRGAEDEMELYYKEESKGPGDQEIRDAIKQLRENVAEALYLIGKCYLRLREEEEALAAYKRLRREHPESKWAKEVEEEIELLKRGTAKK